MTQPDKISLLGDINIDMVMKIHEYPSPGGDGMAEHVLIQAGGSASNTAILLTRLGVQTQLFARVGSDPWGGAAVDTLRKVGVGLDWLQRDEQTPSGILIIPVTPDGERTMFTFRGANANTDPAGIQPERLAGSRMLHLSSYAFLTSPQRDAAWRAVELATQAGISISLDVGVEPAHALRPQAEKLLPRLDLLVLSEQEALVLSGQKDHAAAVAFLLQSGVRRLAIKLGKEGCQISTRAEEIFLPGFLVQPVDTTGAGDAFCAGMLYALLRGCDLRQAGTLANALGALATTRQGASISLPTREELVAFLREHAGELLKIM